MALNKHEKPRILVINPNSTASMSESLRVMLANHADITEQYEITVTQPSSGPSSINNNDDAAESLPHCISYLKGTKFLETQDAFLVACYSDHPLVAWLRRQMVSEVKPVIGIFEASAEKSVQSLKHGKKYGIVSTGKVWETLLSKAVRDLGASVDSLGSSGNPLQHRFGGVETTGLNATELHDAPQEQVHEKIRQATKRLIRENDIGAICLGCAGMAGMDEIVREALREELGVKAGNQVAIVDGVLAGVEILGRLLKG